MIATFVPIWRRTFAVAAAWGAVLVAWPGVGLAVPAAAPLPSPALANPAATGSGPEQRPNPPHLEPLPAAGLTIADAEAIALASHPALGRALALVDAARGRCVQVGLKPNPVVGYEGQQLGSNGQAEQHGVLVGQEFVTGGKLQLNRQIACRDVEIVQQRYAAERLRILTAVRIAFVEVLVARRQIALADELVRLGAEVGSAVDALHRAQEVGRVDVLQAQLERDQAEILRQTAGARADAAWRQLAAALGDPLMPPQTLEGDPHAAAVQFQYDEQLARLLSHSPAMAIATLELQRACAVLARAEAEPIPNVSVQGLVNWRDNGIGGGSDGGVLVSLPVPLYDRNQGAIHAAQRDVAAARQAIARLELELAEGLARIFEDYATARQQAEKYRTAILPAAEESLQLTRELYQTGETNYTALLTAQRTYASAQRQSLDASLRLRIAEAQILGLSVADSRAAGDANAAER